MLKLKSKKEKSKFLVPDKVGKGKYYLKNKNTERIEDQVAITNKEHMICSYGLQFLIFFSKVSYL